LDDFENYWLDDVVCHSERSEESIGGFAPHTGFANPAGFLATLRMTVIEFGLLSFSMSVD
jgi:hypothetical protein